MFSARSFYQRHKIHAQGQEAAPYAFRTGPPEREHAPPLSDAQKEYRKNSAQFGMAPDSGADSGTRSDVHRLPTQALDPGAPYSLRPSWLHCHRFRQVVATKIGPLDNRFHGNR